jgi:hypothetical protein
MATLRIHGVSPSTFTRTVRLACHEKGIDYEMIDAMPGNIGPLNPFHKIPAITHGDVTPTNRSRSFATSSAPFRIARSCGPTTSPPRRRAELQPLVGRDGGAAQRQGDGAHVQAADCRLKPSVP